MPFQFTPLESSDPAFCALVNVLVDAVRDGTEKVDIMFGDTGRCDVSFDGCYRLSLHKPLKVFVPIIERIKVAAMESAIYWEFNERSDDGTAGWTLCLHSSDSDILRQRGRLFYLVERVEAELASG